MNTTNVTRLEIIDHTPCKECGGTGEVEDWNYSGQMSMCTDCHGSGMLGRTVVFWDKNKQVDLELQDDEQTLKVFIHERYEETQPQD